MADVITPAAFAHTIGPIVQLLADWGWRAQRWGQEALTPDIREVLVRTENGLRHIGDVIAARPAGACLGCRRAHGDLVCHIDVKSSTYSAANRTGWLSLEVLSWQAMRDETRTTIPAVFVFAPWRDCPPFALRWIPAARLSGEDMRMGPRNGNGSGDAYWLLPEGAARPIQSLRCWDGWS